MVCVFTYLFVLTIEDCKYLCWRKRVSKGEYFKLGPRSLGCNTYNIMWVSNPSMPKGYLLITFKGLCIPYLGELNLKLIKPMQGKILLSVVL